MSDPVGDGRRGPRDVVVDVSCGGLVVATGHGHAVLDPAVAATSVLATLDGSDLPPGGDRLECSERVDALTAARPADRLADPYAWAHRDRVEVSGLSVPVVEMLEAPLRRALRWAGAAPGCRVVLVVPTAWGDVRIERLEGAARRLGVRAHAVRAALVCADALPSSSARWTVVVEGDRGTGYGPVGDGPCDAGTSVALVERLGREIVLRARELVPAVEPWDDTGGSDVTGRVVRAVRGLRADTPGAATGSFEVLVCGAGAEQLVDALDRVRVLSFPLPPAAVACSLVRTLRHG